MINLIKIATVSFIVFIFVNTANAQNICDPSCSTSIVFNPSGSVQAVEAMVFTFSAGSELNLGVGGTVNTAVQPANLNFSAGGDLTLVAGDSITFGENGFLTMMPGSNINATSFNVVNGNLAINSPFRVALRGGISVDGDFSIISQEIALHSDIQVVNDLNVSSASLVNGVVLSGSGDITTGLMGSISIDGSIISSIGTVSVSEINSGMGVISSGSLQLDAQPLEDLSILEGYEISALDGTLCTVSGDECVAANGDVYKLVDGDLVKQESGNGSLETGSLIILLMYFLAVLQVRLRKL